MTPNFVSSNFAVLCDLSTSTSYFVVPFVLDNDCGTGRNAERVRIVWICISIQEILDLILESSSEVPFLLLVEAQLLGLLTSQFRLSTLSSTPSFPDSQLDGSSPVILMLWLLTLVFPTLWLLTNFVVLTLWFLVPNFDSWLVTSLISCVRPLDRSSRSSPRVPHFLGCVLLIVLAARRLQIPKDSSYCWRASQIWKRNNATDA